MIFCLSFTSCKTASFYCTVRKVFVMISKIVADKMLVSVKCVYFHSGIGFRQDSGYFYFQKCFYAPPFLASYIYISCCLHILFTNIINGNVSQNSKKNYNCKSFEYTIKLSINCQMKISSYWWVDLMSDKKVVKELLLLRGTSPSWKGDWRAFQTTVATQDRHLMSFLCIMSQWHVAQRNCVKRV